MKPRNRPATDEELALFAATCERTGLDPFARQIYAQFRTDSRTQRENMAIQATIDGFRVVAERSGDYLGGDAPQWCGTDGEWRDVWTAEGHPVAARITVHKSLGGLIGDTTVVAHWKEYAPSGAAGQMWTKMPALMLAKVAEALALRRAFPMVLSGLYTAEEMAQATPERIPDPEAPTEPAVITNPAAVRDLKAAAKAAELNWGKVKECYVEAGLTAPGAFTDAFMGLADGEDARLLVAIENRATRDSTDAPYPAAEIAPAAPGETSDLPWAIGDRPEVDATEPSAGSGDTEVAGDGPVQSDAAPLTPLPVGEAPIDALLAAAAKEADGGELTDQERALLEGADDVVAGAMGDPEPVVELTDADLILLDAFVLGKGLVNATANILGTPPALARVAVLDLKQRVGLKTNVALLEWAQRRLAA